MKKTAITLGALFVMLCALSSAAQAQAILASRTFVSSAGSDANACSVTSPCLTFSGAASKTASRGEITALDSGAYGNITITRPVTLQAAPGALAALGSLSSTTPVVINGGESDVVVLRNLQISRAGFANATRGIQLVRVGALHIENCVVTGFSDTGIYAAPQGINSDLKGPRLFVKDTIVRDNGTGIYLSSVFASIDRSRMENNLTGVLAQTQARVTLRDCLLAGNQDYGLATEGPSTVAAVENCVVTNNGTGITASGSFTLSSVFVSHTMLAGNTTGLSPNGGTIKSFGNNRLANNNADGAFTSTIEEK
jgi:hypothetical protein